MLDKNQIIDTLSSFNDRYKESGFRISGLFGSYARGEEDLFSDIDLTYTIEHDKFYKNDAFAKLNKIEEFKQELETLLKKKVDLVPLQGANNLLQKNLDKEQIAI